jgi:DNA mismatch repair protein MutS2
LIGIPGRSNALNIASRLGLDKKIIDYARSKVSTETIEAGALIERLEENRRISEEYREETQRLKEEAAKLKSQYEKAKKDLENERQELVKKNASQVLAEIEKNKKELEQLIAEIRESKSLDDAKELRRLVEEEEKKRKDQVFEAEKKRRSLKPREELVEGQQVLLRQSNLPAVILQIEGNKALVQAGIMKINVPLVDLEPMEKEVEKKPSISRYNLGKATIGIELNVIGKTVDEAIDDIDRYLDSAILAGLASVRIIHGKGTGALRKGIQEFLRSHPSVKGFRDGGQGEGGKK